MQLGLSFSIMLRFDDLIFVVRQYLQEAEGTFHIAYSDRGYAMIIDDDSLDSYECDNSSTLADVQHWLISHNPHKLHYEILEVA